MTRTVGRSVIAGALVLGAAAAAVGVVAQRQREFPHEEHAGMFPLCEGCHQGVPEGDRATFYPTPAQCAGCHDGTEQPRVDWQAPSEEPDNVVFSHPEHPLVDDGQPIDCTTCHVSAGAPRMAVAEAPVVANCLACHEHRADAHYIDADCSTCHMPLAEAPFGRARLAALPEPTDHEGDDFLAAGHGLLAASEQTRCAVCHTREQCSSCHVDAAFVSEIAAMPEATGIVARELPPFDARYPVPSSHRSPDFLEEHGPLAATGTCTSCHTQEDCTTCHISPVPVAVRGMIARADTRAPGVGTVRRMPASHDAPLFTIDHGSVAASGAASCTACHTRTMCADCHDALESGAQDGAAAHATSGARATVSTGASEPATARTTMNDAPRPALPGAFHPANFMARHSAEAYGRRLECSNCHDSRLFCADCHASAGMSPGSQRGRLGPGFHDAEPLWLLRHGQAARQGLESCASCHEQNECMQCHSVLGAFKVSPHGPGFDARRAQKRNAAVCLICHITDPLNGRT